MAYYIGKVWDACLNQTDIQVIWNDPLFKQLDRTIQNNLTQIKQDVLSLVDHTKLVDMHDFDDQHARLVDIKNWKTIWLKYFGYPVIDQLKDIINNSMVYNASISILEPGGKIPLHVGQCRSLVKYHIPIYIPKGDCFMIYNGKRYEWSDRMLFNDTLPHMVENNTEERRIIILMDIIRPMTIPWNIFNDNLLKIVWLDPIVKRRYTLLQGTSHL